MAKEMFKKVIFGLLTLFILLGLAGCGATSDSDLTIKSDDTWKLMVDFSVNIQDDAYMQAGFTNLVDSEKQRITGTSVKMSNKRELNDQTMHYIFTFEGKGFTDLENMWSNALITKGANNQVTISMAMPDATMGKTTVTIHTEKIISSNATSVNGNTAVWDSSKGTRTIQTTIEPVAKFRIVWLILLALVTTVLAITGILLMGVKYGTLRQNLAVQITPRPSMDSSSAQTTILYRSKIS